MTNSIAALRIRFTADLFTPDPPCIGGAKHCTCTNVYGEPTEHGYGETMESGWYASRWEVTDNREEALTIEPDAWEIAEMIVGEVVREYEWARDYRTVGEWVIGQVEDVLGSIDHHEPDGAPYEGSYYAADPDQDYRTGESAMVAAHVTSN